MSSFSCVGIKKRRAACGQFLGNWTPRRGDCTAPKKTGYRDWSGEYSIKLYYHSRNRRRSVQIYEQAGADPKDGDSGKVPKCFTRRISSPEAEDRQPGTNFLMRIHDGEVEWKS